MQSMTGRWIPDSINNQINITKYWLAGFIDGEGTFSTNRSKPRFRIENHIKELELYNKIKAFVNVGNVLYTSTREDRVNSSPTIVLEIHKVQDLRKNLIPLMYENNCILLKTLKAQDFILWLKLVDLYYKGYHTTLEGKYIFDSIKLHMNKGYKNLRFLRASPCYAQPRLTTNVYLVNKERISILEIDNLLTTLYLSESPYEIRNGVRFIRNTDKLVKGTGTKIFAIDSHNNSIVYNSIGECAKSINIPSNKIKECLNTGNSIKGYSFALS